MPLSSNPGCITGYVAGAFAQELVSVAVILAGVADVRAAVPASVAVCVSGELAGVRAAVPASVAVCVAGVHASVAVCVAGTRWCACQCTCWCTCCCTCQCSCLCCW